MSKYSDNALAIYKRLYLDEKQHEKDPNDVHHRVGNFISTNDRETKDFIEVLTRNEFRPNSPCLINAGRKSDKAHDKQLCACFVLGLEDSMESIIEMWSICAKIYASGAGAGIPITNLREHGSAISSGGVASGPLKYLKVVDVLSDTVRSGGRTRRAANIGTFTYNHPETLDIISSKDSKGKELTSFNLSIAMTDEIMNLVNEKDAKYPIVSPNNNEQIGENTVQDLWDRINRAAWNCGDPGILFIDRVNEYNPLPSFGKIESTNPCLSGNTLILTKTQGYKTIESLVNQPIKVWNGHRWTKVTPQVTGYDQEMLTIVFSNGEELTCTKYHRFKLNDGSEVKAEDLTEGDKLAKWTMPVVPDPATHYDNHNDAYTQGFFCGDGFHDTYHDWYCIRLYGVKQELVKHFDYLTKRQEDGRIHIRLPNNYHSKEFVPFNYYTLQYKLEYLAGICDSDGTITKDGSIQISSINFQYLLDLKRMLNTIGIDCVIAISHNKKTKRMPDGHGGLKRYDCQTCYRMSISPSRVEKLIEQGFKTRRLDLRYVKPKIANGRYVKVVSIQDNNEIHKKVYCFNDPIDGMGMFNNISTSQCGEVPLLPWSVCNIGSINVSAFVRNGQIDWGSLIKTVHTCSRFLNNVIDKTTYLDKRFEDMCKRTRPFGLGLMGFADLLIKLKISYGSKESIELFEKLCFTINKEAIRTSIKMAEEQGPIDLRDLSNASDNTMHFRNLLKHYTNNDKEILDEFDEWGIRNITWTCIAPTGSISMSADCSYAWEPLMALVWEKPLVDSNEVLKIIHPAFEEVLDQIIKRDKIDKDQIMNDIICNHGSIQNLTYFDDNIKRIFKVAHDIDPFTKIEMQGKGQKYISLAISSTVNLPNSATIDDIDKIHKHAYVCGLKGVTIFRDGCLDHQIVNFGKIKTDSNEHRRKTDQPFKRPIKRSGDTVEINTPYGKLFVTCNVNKDKEPFEIFFRVGKQGALTNVLVDALGRVCSKSLQAGIPIEVIIDTLRGLQGEKFWFKIADEEAKSTSAESIVDAISQLLEYHWYDVVPKVAPPIEDVQLKCGDAPDHEECPVCHRKTLRRDAGCRGGSCIACGFSNCG